MAPGSKAQEKPKTSKAEKKKRARRDNVVTLVTHGQISGQFPERSFRKLSPLALVPLRNIVSEELQLADPEEPGGHVFLGFVQSGRYILSYADPVDSYTLYWWEFNLHSKLRLVQKVTLFAGKGAGETDLDLHVCEWPDDDSRIVVFGFQLASATSTDQLMTSVQNKLEAMWSQFVTIAPNPPSEPCTQCSGDGVKCLEHGIALHAGRELYSPFPFPFQPALQLKKDKIILLRDSRTLVACAVHLCPTGEQSPSRRMLHAKRPPVSSRPPPLVRPQGRPEGFFALAALQCLESSAFRSPPDRSPSSSAPLPTHGYVDYRRLQYRLSQGEIVRAEGEDTGRCLLLATDLNGRALKSVPSCLRDGQSLCVEEMELRVGDLLSVLVHGDAVWESRSFWFDFVLLEVCPETDRVLIGIGLFWEHEVRDMQVIWDLGTGLCSAIGVCDITNDVPFSSDVVRHCIVLASDLDDLKDDKRLWRKHRQNLRIMRCYRKSCVDTVRECSVPQSSSHHVNVLTADGEFPKEVLADTERCTWVTTKPPEPPGGLEAE